MKSQIVVFVLAATAVVAPLSQQGCGHCMALAVCDAGDLAVEECPEGGDCYENSICESSVLCLVDGAQCEGAPSCDPGDVEVQSCPNGAECYEQTLCGSTILCQVTANCAAVPSCDAGDTQLSGACPDDGVCYDVTECGSTITCSDDGLPLHGCQSAEPVPGDPCDPETTPTECEYPPCGFYGCQDVRGTFQWVVTGGCGEGGAGGGG